MDPVTNEEVKVYPTTADNDGFYYATAADEAAGIETRNVNDKGGKLLRKNGEEQYPSIADTDGWYYESEGQAALQIETRVDSETEDTEKRIKLSRGRIGIMRELTRKENNTAKTIAGLNGKNSNVQNPALQDKAMAAMIAVGTKFYDKDGKELKYVMEDILEFKGKDSNRLDAACGSLNF